MVAIGDKKIGNFPLVFDDDGLESGRSMRTLDTTNSSNLKNGINTLSFNLESLIENFGIDFPNHLKIDVDGNETILVSKYGGKPFNQPNDLWIDLAEIRVSKPKPIHHPRAEIIYNNIRSADQI